MAMIKRVHYFNILDNIASTSSLKSTDSGLQVRCVAFNNVGEKAEVTVLEISGLVHFKF